MNMDKTKIVKDLMEANIEENMNMVMNRWELATMGAEDRRQATRQFIQMFGSYGKMQLTALRKDRNAISRDFAVTLEPKEDNFEEYQLVLRHVIFKNKKANGLEDNTIGTTVHGRFEMDDFDSLWEMIQRRRNDDDSYVM